MSSNIKNNEVLTAIPETGTPRPVASSGAASVDPSSRSQPVALDVPVTVNGARAVAGSDKREPFSESTKTVLIFGHGAVVRLASSVAPGQLLFLTNEKTKKEVVCQVVKSKNYQNVSGYVELEFTEPVAGFWGARFSPERGSSQSSQGSTLQPPSVQRSSQAPVAPSAAIGNSILNSSAPQSRPATPVSSPVASSDSPAPNSPATAAVSSPAASSAHASSALPTEPVQKISKERAEIPSFLDADERTIEQQLADLFPEDFTKTKKTAPLSGPRSTAPVSNAAEIKPASTTPPASTISPATLSSVPAMEQTPKSSGDPFRKILDSDEIKIPAWLEPLARNASAVSAAAWSPEITEKESADVRDEGDVTEAPDLTVTEISAIPEPAEQVPAEPSFGTTYMLADENDLAAGDVPEEGSKKKFMIGAIAAVALLVLILGGWYAFRSPADNGAPVTSAVAKGSNSSSPSRSQGSSSNQSNTSGVTSKPGRGAATTDSATGSASASGSKNSSAAAPHDNSANSATNSTTNSPEITNASLNSISDAPASGNAAGSVAAKRKKSNAASPRLPTAASSKSKSEDNLEEALNLNAPSAPLAGEGLASGLLISNSKQPVAPGSAPAVKIGGDVRPAKLISTVSPAYPPMAKSQRLSGDVKIDALIDASGNVTSVTVLSGPTLLQDSALEAVRHWKYQPAQLDGKPVAMHLTVTVQFHLH